MIVLDAHALVLSADRMRYPFAGDAPPPQPGELEACTEVAGLRQALADRAPAGAVLVQRNRFHGHDNSLICDLAAASPALRALCSVDARRADAGAMARHWLEARGAHGLRFMEPEKGSDLGWLAGDAARDAWRAAAERGAVVDVHVFPWNRVEALAALAGLLRDFPDMPVLLDNLGNAAIEAGAPDFGIDAALRGVIDHPRLTLKFSDMTVQRAGRAGLEPTDIVARFAALVGAERLAWGSDVLPAGVDLGMAVEHAIGATAGLDEASRWAVLHDNVAALFGFAA